MSLSDEIQNVLEQDQPQETKPSAGISLGSIVLLLGVISVSVVVGLSLLQNNSTQPTGGPAPDFTVTTFDGEEITLSDLKGRVVVVNFWGSWCGPCRAEAPDLQTVHENYQDEGVVILGITYLDRREDSLTFIEELGLTYPNAPDPGTKIAEDQYHIQGAPESFIIDREGNIAHFQYGPITAPRLSEIIDGLLEAA